MSVRLRRLWCVFRGEADVVDGYARQHDRERHSRPERVGEQRIADEIHHAGDEDGGQHRIAGDLVWPRQVGRAGAGGRGRRRPARRTARSTARRYRRAARTCVSGRRRCRARRRARWRRRACDSAGCTRAMGLKNSPSSAIAKNTRGAVSMMPMSAPNVETVTTTDTNATPMRPKIACMVSAAIERRLRQSLDRVDVEIGDVGGQVDRDDGQRAADDGARQRALRILDLAGGKRQIGEAVVGPEHGDRSPDRRARDRPAPSGRGEVRERRVRSADQKGRERSDRPARRTWRPSRRRRTRRRSARRGC